MLLLQFSLESSTYSESYLKTTGSLVSAMGSWYLSCVWCSSFSSPWGRRPSTAPLVWTRWRVKYKSNLHEVQPVLGIRDVYPRSWFLSIPDLRFGSNNSNKRRGGKYLLSHLLWSHKCHKIVNYFIFELKKKKIEQNLQRIIELLPKKLKIVTKLWKTGCGFWDSRSGKTYSGSRGQ